MSDSCDLMDCSPVYIFLELTLCVCVCACSAGQSWTATPWTVASQALLSMEFYMQEYWSGLLFSTPGYLPNPGIKTVWLVSPALAGRFLPSEPSGEP